LLQVPLHSVQLHSQNGRLGRTRMVAASNGQCSNDQLKS